MEEMRRTLEEYQEFMTKISTTIVSVTDNIGLISMLELPFEVTPERFMSVSEAAMKEAVNMRLHYIVLDASRLSAVRAVYNIPAFRMVTEAFRLIGIQVVISGISPEVAMQAVTMGETFGNIKTFGRLADALEYLSK